MNRGAEFVMKLINLVTPELKSIANQAGVSLSKMDGFTASLDRVQESSLHLSSLHSVLGNASSAMDEITISGKGFDSSMKDLEAITGVAGEQLDTIGEKARKSAMVFGGDAAAQVESYKNILSQLSPDIAKNSEALAMMGTNVGLLSKTMNGDTVGATEAMTVAMNQYGVSLEDPIKAAESMAAMSDIMANAARIGSAEVPDLAASVKVAGLSAKNAGVEFEEFNASIEVLAMGSIKGAEAGTGLRNVLAIMGKGDFLPKHTMDALKDAGVNVNVLKDTTIPLVERLEELKKVQGDTALIGKLFGMENQNVAMQLLGNTDVLKTYTSQLENSSGVTKEMATIVMGSWNERMSRIGATFKDVGISIFGATKDYLPFLQASVYGLDLYTRMAPVFLLAKGAAVSFINTIRVGAAATWSFVSANAAAGLGLLKTAGQFLITGTMAVGSFVSSMLIATASTWGLNVAMYANPVGIFIAGFVAIVAAIALVIVYWDELADFLMEWGKYLNPFAPIILILETFFPEIWESITGFFTSVWEWIVGWVGGVGEILGNLFDGFTGADIDLGTTKQSEMHFKEKEESVSSKGQKEISRDSKVDESSKARIVNVRFDKIEINNTFQGAAMDGDMEEWGERFTTFVVSGVRDAEAILSNG